MNIVNSNLGSRSLISQERNDKNNVYIEIEDNIEPVNKNTVTKGYIQPLKKCCLMNRLMLYQKWK